MYKLLIYSMKKGNPLIIFEVKKIDSWWRVCMFTYQIHKQMLGDEVK